MDDKNPPLGALEETVHKMERLQLKNSVEFNVLMRAVWSLITTHPDRDHHRGAKLW